MLVNRNNLWLHSIWFIAFLLGTLAAVFTLIDVSTGDYRPPRGASTVGYSFGLVAGLLIVFEVLLWPRKKLKRWRLGRLRTWMAAHIWLGLLTVPLALAHGGLFWKGSLAFALMVLLIVVVISGLVGLALQNILPSRLRQAVPDETIFSQIDNVSHQYLAEADALVSATCGRAAAEFDASFWSRLNPIDPGEGVNRPAVIGAVRSMAVVKGTAMEIELPEVPIPNTDHLHAVYRSTIREFLQHGRRSHSPLRRDSQAQDVFRDLRLKLDAAASPAIDALERWCDLRRQFDRQQKLHFWLHCWMAIHVPLSLALLVLLIWHALVASRYSGIF